MAQTLFQLENGAVFNAVSNVIINKGAFALDSNSQLGVGDAAPAQNDAAAQDNSSAAGAATDASATEAAAPTSGTSGIFTLVLYGAVIIVAIYFFMFRPQRKREKKMAEMQNSIKVGDNIVTSSGLYGKVVELGQEAHVIEFGMNRGVRIAVRKSDISGIKTPVMTPPHAKEPLAVKSDKTDADNKENRIEDKKENKKDDKDTDKENDK